jgi:hypothetical protein
MSLIEIHHGADNDPPHAMMVVDRHLLSLDLTKVQGQLWDDPTTARVVWGLRTDDGRTYGRVYLKAGGVRNFFDADLLKPYLAAYEAKKAALHPAPEVTAG